MITLACLVQPALGRVIYHLGENFDLHACLNIWEGFDQIDDLTSFVRHNNAVIIDDGSDDRDNDDDDRHADDYGDDDDDDDNNDLVTIMMKMIMMTKKMMTTVMSWEGENDAPS